MEIRSATPKDAARIAAIYRPYVTDSFISFETVPPSPDEMARRIEMTTARFPWLVAEVDGQIVAYAYAGLHNPRGAYRWSCEFTVYSDLSSPRKGIGRALYEDLFRLTRALGYRMAYAGISLPNPMSVGFHEALGFAPVGIYRNAGFKNGRWHDVGWWQAEIQPLGNAPGEPGMPQSA